MMTSPRAYRQLTPCASAAIGGRFRDDMALRGPVHVASGGETLSTCALLLLPADESGVAGSSNCNPCHARRFRATVASRASLVISTACNTICSQSDTGQPRNQHRAVRSCSAVGAEGLWACRAAGRTLPEALIGKMVHARSSAKTTPTQMAATRLPARITTSLSLM